MYAQIGRSSVKFKRLVLEPEAAERNSGNNRNERLSGHKGQSRSFFPNWGHYLRIPLKDQLFGGMAQIPAAIHAADGISAVHNR
jgi:hypothetical protein